MSRTWWFVDLTGRRVGRLRVLRRVGTKYGAPTWLCVCRCGGQCIVAGPNLRKSRTTSCGCRRRTHGMSKTPTYASYRAMRDRCLNPFGKDFAGWGARGIRICKRWLGREGFAHFLADMGTRPPGTTLDRIDVDGDYAPANCRWTDPRSQGRNRRTCRFLEANGRRATLAEWSEATGIPRATISSRLRHGWELEDALGLRPYRHVFEDLLESA